MSRTNKSRFGIRFSMRTLFLVALVLGVAGGWIGSKRLESKRRANAIFELSTLAPERSWQPSLNELKAERNAKHYLRLDRLRSYDDTTSRISYGQLSKTPAVIQWIIGSSGSDVAEINLSFLKVDDEDIMHLIHLPEIQSLNLDTTMVTDNCKKVLQRLPSLKSLCLGQTNISDAVVTELGTLKNLESLQLWHNEISDAKLQELANLVDLKKLNLCGTNVTESGVNLLQSKLPDCKIWWDGEDSFQLLNQCPRLRGEFETHNPVYAIGAINHLQQLGKTRALETFQEYTRVAPGSNNRGIYCRTRLQSIIPILFLPTNQKTAPFWDIKRRSPGNYKNKAWPFSVVSLEGDIPFRDYALAGNGGGWNFETLLDWVEENCQLRASPLQPSDTPYLAAEELIKRSKRRPDLWSKIGLDSEEVLPQVENMLRHLENPDASVRWDTVKQNYVNVDSDR